MQEKFQSSCKFIVVLKKTKMLRTATTHRLRSCVALMVAFRQFQKKDLYFVYSSMHD